MQIAVEPFLNAEQCQVIAQKVKALRQFYLDRGGFYTLGAAVYRDDPLLYPTLSRLLNTLLVSQFTDLLEAQVRFFSERLDRKVVWFDGLAVPGFHVFDRESARLQGFIHTDTPEENIGWSEPYSDPFSYTIAIELPKNGGGLNLWPDSGITEHTDPEGQGEPVYFPYEEGRLYLHDGKIPHQIANTKPIEGDDYRITVQGHGVLLGKDRYTLFF